MRSRVFSKCFSSLSTTEKICSLISVPVNLGQPFFGPDRSPSLIKEHGLLQLLSSCGWRVHQLPDIKSPQSSLSSSSPNEVVPSGVILPKNCAQVGSVCEAIYQQVSKEAATGNFLLILGGDHCIPIGTLPGILNSRPNTGVVWVDAHADINTPSSSPSGNMHGMPLAFLLGLVPEVHSLPSLQWFPKTPQLKPRDVVYIGLRDLDPTEKVAIKKLGIRAYTMYEIDRLGIGKVMEEVQDYMGKKDIHLSYDIDALDPFFAPHTGTAVRGGLTFREGAYICEALYATGRLTSMELVEVNPSLHQQVDSKHTIDVAMSLIGAGMGIVIL